MLDNMTIQTPPFPGATTVTPPTCAPANPTPTTSVEALTGTFNKTPLESKKWVAMIIGVSIVVLIWLTTVMIMAFKPSIAAHLVSIGTIVISFVGAMVTTLITGQAAMEWKSATAISEIATTTSNNSVNTNYEIKKSIVEDDGTKLKPFGQLAK